MALTSEDIKKMNSSLGAQANAKFRDKSQDLAKEGRFSRAIDFLMRPNYASAGAAKALVSGGKENVWNEFWKGLKGEEKETYSDVFDSMGWKPTTKMGKVARGVTGFAADVLLDPTTYMGVGAVNKLGRAIKAGKVLKGAAQLSKQEKAAIAFRKAIFKTEKVADLTQDLAPTLAKQAKAGQRSLLQIGGKTLVKGEPVFKGLTKAAEALEKFKWIQDLGAGAKGGGLNIKWIKPTGMTDEVWAGFKKGAAAKRKAEIVGGHKAIVGGKKFLNGVKDALSKGVKEDDINQIIMKMSDNTVEILPELQPLYDDFSKIRDLSNDTLKSVGDALLSGFDMAHIPTDEYFKMFPMKEYAGSFGKKFDVPKQYHRAWFKTLDGDIVNLVEGTLYKDGNAKKLSKKDVADLVNPTVAKPKKVFGGTVISAQEQLRARAAKRAIKEGDTLANGLKIANPVEINKGVGKDIFETQLGVIAAGMMNKIGKIQGGIEFAENMKKFGKMAHEVSGEGWKTTSLKLLKDADGKALYFPSAVAGHLDEIFEKYSNPELMNIFLKKFKTMQNTWKGIVTYLNVPFHARNAVSNVWQNYLAGVVPGEKAYFIAAKIKGDLALGKKLTGKNEKYMAEFLSEGLGGIGQMGADIQKSLKEPGKLYKYTFGWGRAIGETIEDHAKLAHFISKRKKGFSSGAAARSAQKYLFDYGDLSDFEQMWMKSIAPFYTWSRKNMPLQIETLIKTPEKIARMGKLKAAIEQGYDKKNKPKAMLLPKWMKERMPIYMGGDKNISKFSMLGGWLPSADIGDVLEPLKTAFSNVSPFLKGGFELNANYNTFFRQEISQYPGQREKFLGLHIPRGWKFVLQQIRPLTETDRVFKLRYDPLTKDYEKKIGKALTEYVTGFKVYENDLKYLKRNVSGKGWSPSTIYQKIERDLNAAKKKGRVKGIGQQSYKDEAKRLKELLDTYDKWNQSL